MNKIKMLLTTLCVYFLNSGITYSVELPDEMKSVMAHDSIGTPSMLHLVVSMAVVIAMIYITGWIYNKLNLINRKKLKQISKSDLSQFNFNIIQSISLGQQRQLYSIEMGNKVLLVGSTPSQITLLKEFDTNIDNDEKEICANESDTSSAEEKWSDKKSLDIDELYRKYKN